VLVFVFAVSEKRASLAVVIGRIPETETSVL